MAGLVRVCWEHNGAPYYRQTGGDYPRYRDAQTAWRAGWELGSTEDDDSSPLSITLQSEGELAAKCPYYLGTFTKTDQWSYGRPVFRNQAGMLLYCYLGGWWRVGDTSDDKGDIWCCGSAGLWPSQAGEWGCKKGDFF